MGSETITIQRRYRVEQSLDPINVIDFVEDMLFTDVNDPTVFKTCAQCGKVWAFNTEQAYHTRMVVCHCGKKQTAKDMQWTKTRFRIDGDLVFDWESYSWKRLVVKQEQ